MLYIFDPTEKLKTILNPRGAELNATYQSGWQMEIEQTSYHYYSLLYGRSHVAQGFKPTEDMVNKRRIRAQIRSSSTGYTGIPPDTHWYIYSDNDGVPGSSITEAHGVVVGSDWNRASWISAQITLSEPLQAGQQYWLVVVGQGGDYYNCVRYVYSGADVYADGYRCTSSDGQTWLKFTDRDLTFKIEAPVYDTIQSDPCPYYEAIHSEKLTGENTFTFSVPADHQDAQYVVEGNLVAFKDLDANWQLFEIKRVTDLHGDGLTRTAFCEHAFYELIDDFIEDIRPYDVSAHFALTQALSGTRWQPGDVADLGLNSTNYYYESALSAVQKVASVWGGELRFRVVVTGGVISDRYVDLLARRGAETGKQFAYSKDIKSIEREVDLTETKTALYGRGKGVEVGEGYGRRLDFADVIWTAPPNPVDKPAGQEWVGDPAALAQWGRAGGTRHRFGVFEDPEETDAERLLQKTWDALQERKNPRITYRLDVADLERLSGYEHEKVRLGDTVRVIDRAFSPALLVEARVIEINRDLLRPENTRITMGNFAPTIADETLKVQETIQTVRDRQGVWDTATPFTGPVPTSWLDGIIDTLQNEVRAGNGSVTLTDDNGIMIADNPDNPTKALRLLGGLLAISNEKDPVTGEWVWRTFGTGDGFTADLLNAGQIRTSLVQILGNSNFYWDGDYLYIINPDDQNQQIRFSKEGIRFTRDGGQTWRVAMDFDGIRMEGQSQDGYTHYVGDGVKVYDEQGNLVGHLGSFEALGNQTATFTRNSVAYKQDGSAVASGVPRFESGKFGQAVMVEEGTANLLLYSQDFTQAVWDKRYVGVSSAGTYLGYPVTRFTPNTPGQSSWVSQIFLSSGAANRTFTWSFWARGQTNRQFRVNFYGGVSGTFVSYIIDLTTEWQKFTITHTFPSNATSARIQWGNATPYWGVDYTDWIEVAGVQVEEKPYSTSYMKTTSSTATRSPETLTIPTAGVLNPQEGTIEFWVKPLIVTNYNNFFSMTTSNGRFLLFFASDGKAKFDYGATNSGITTPAGTITANNWHHIILRWSATTGKQALFVNGVKYEQNLPNGVASSFPSTVSIVNNYSAYIDDLRISNRARTDQEIADAYASGQPLPVDEWTTYKMSFDGHLSPTIRNYGLWSKNGQIILQNPQAGQGLEVWDGATRKVLIGRLDDGTIGQEIRGGKIYSTQIQSGAPGDKDYIQLGVGFKPLEVVVGGKTALSVWAWGGWGGTVQWYDTKADEMRGQITPYDDALGQGLRIDGRNNSGSATPLLLVGSQIMTRADYTNIQGQYGSGADVTVWGDLHVTGTLSAGSKSHIQDTENSGKRLLYVRESPDMRYIIEGRSSLIDGKCRIDLDPVFLECIEPDTDETPWLIHLTPFGDARVKVSEVGPDYILISGGEGSEDSLFCWYLSAVRKGYAGIWLEKHDDGEDVLDENWEDEFEDGGENG